MEPMESGRATLPLLKKNQVVFDRLNLKTYRILYVSEADNNLGYWIQLDSNANVPLPFQVQDIQERLLADTFTFTADTSLRVPFDDELSEAALRRRDKAWGLIQNVVTIEPDIYDSSRRIELLRNVEIASGVKLNHMYVYLGKYWRSGFRPNVLAPNYQNCGGTRILEEGKNVGRHKREGNNGKVLNDRDYECFEYAVEHFYRKGKSSLHQAYDDMLACLYIQPRKSADEKPVSLNPDQKPSFSQFYYWYRKCSNIVEVTAAREGRSKFNLNHRSIPGHTRAALFGPGHSFQMDATIGDFYLVMETDRGRLIGRPVIVVVIDAWSDIVAGVSITLENSSSSIWKEALLNAVTSKVEFCRQFNIEITEDEWPCQVLPVSITTDNGEFAVKAIDEVVRTLGITVEECPPYRGDLKGIVERLLGTEQFALKPYIPGYVDKDAGERGATDYRKPSCFDYKSFVEVFLRILLFHNNNHYMECYERTDDLRKNAIPSIPRDLWNYGIAHLTGTLKVPSPEEYLDVLLQKDTATVTGKGIRFNFLFYTCKEAIENQWMEKARIEGPYDIPIRYSVSSCAHIYIKGTDGKYIRCDLVNAYAGYEGHSQDEINAFHEQDLDLKAQYNQQEDQAFAVVHSQIQKIVDRCSSQKESGAKIVGALHKHNIDENRAEEKKNLSGETQARKEQAAMGLDPTADSSKTSAGQSGCHTNCENSKPKSFDVIDEQIDRILAEMKNGQLNV